MDAAPLLRAVDLRLSSTSPGVDVELRPGARLGVLGGPGSGKTALLRALARLMPTVGGRLEWQGRDVTRVGRWRLGSQRRFVALLLANPYTSFAAQQPVRAVLRSASRDTQSFTTVLERVGLPPAVLSQRVCHLSGAQRIRLGLALAHLNQAAVWLLDDGAQRLLPEGWMQVLHTADVAGEEHTAIVVTSRTPQAVAGMHQLLVLCNGAGIEGGSSAEVLSAPTHPYTQYLLLGTLPEVSGNGCGLAAHCAQARPECTASLPPLTALSAQHWVRCHAVAG